ncbi:AraC family transcriptional regulator [Elizabethkingia bruuniana]|uniref:AraC family transcriptional regulator n=1 Tax=Elizabethkingia bruuniana TaxID=1756149 RepID=UPI00241F8885|nr:AraC family transcriptional regulator [Elizabethkingia bruuniana]
MPIPKKYLLFFLLVTFLFCKPQNLKISEHIVNNKYDDIEAKDLKFNNLNEINKLYNYSLEKGYQSGILRGLVAMQRHYLTNGNYTLSIQYGEKALEVAKKLNNYTALSTIHTYNGNIYTILGLYDEAEKSLDTAVRYSEIIDNVVDKNLVRCSIYNNFAGLYEGKGNRDSILYYISKSLNLIENTPTYHLNELQKTKCFYMIIFQNMNIGNFYVYSGDPSYLVKAEPYFLKALSFSTIKPKYFGIAALDVYESVSFFYLKKKGYKKCIEYSEKALDVERKNTNPRSRLSVYEHLKASYDSLGDISQQNKYLKLYITLNDSLTNNKKESIISSSNEKINKSELEASNLRKYLLLFFIFTVLIIFIIGLYSYGYSRKSQNKYDSLISKLQQNNNPELNSQDEQFNVEEESVSIKSNLSIDKEQNIIKKLISFEASEKFLRKNITLSYLSLHLNTNPKYLSQIINKEKGQNFNTYINHLRINYILYKLYNNSLYREYKISYLAEECGYASPQVFINAFRKETGMTPSYFINNLKS